MNELQTALEAIPDGEALHVALDCGEFTLSNFEAVDPSIYGRSAVMLADVQTNISGPSSITPSNKMEFELAQVRFVKSLDGVRTLYSSSEQ